MKKGREGPRVLYVVYWGAAEPLGQALVIPAVERLQALGAGLTLVTFDKPEDLADRTRVAAIRARLGGLGIRWLSLRYHKRPQAPAKLLDMAAGLAASLSFGLGRTDIVHARTFFGGVIGLFVAPLLRASLIFHNEGFYPDEMVDGGAWQEDSVRHRTARQLEEALYGRADGIITLSHRARQAVEGRPRVTDRKTPVVVVPSVVDLARFRPRPNGGRGNGAMRLVYTGSIGYRYLFEKVARFCKVAAQELGGLRLRVLTRTDPRLVAQILRSSGLAEESWSVEAKPYEAMPEELAPNDAGLFFLTQGRSEHGCSPTKIGEYWACGLPVVTTPNVSDTDAIIREEGVGVIVPEHSDEAYRQAARRLMTLLGEADLRERCRRAAERHYSLEAACRTQMELYSTLLRGEAGV